MVVNTQLTQTKILQRVPYHKGLKIRFRIVGFTSSVIHYPLQ